MVLCIISAYKTRRLAPHVWPDGILRQSPEQAVVDTLTLCRLTLCRDLTAATNDCSDNACTFVVPHMSSLLGCERLRR
jgi:hypothetical protein